MGISDAFKIVDLHTIKLDFPQILHFILQRFETAASIDRSDQKFRAPAWPAVYDIEILHDHQWAGAYSLCHFQSDHVIGYCFFFWICRGDFVHIRNKLAAGKHQAKSLHGSKLFLIEEIEY